MSGSGHHLLLLFLPSTDCQAVASSSLFPDVTTFAYISPVSQSPPHFLPRLLLPISLFHAADVTEFLESEADPGPGSMSEPEVLSDLASRGSAGVFVCMSAWTGISMHDPHAGERQEKEGTNILLLWES